VLRYELIAAVTEQRLAAVLSKTGEVDTHDRTACRELLNDFEADVVESLVTDGLVDSDEAFWVGAGAAAGLSGELDRMSRNLVASALRRRQHGKL